MIVVRVIRLSQKEDVERLARLMTCRGSLKLSQHPPIVQWHLCRQCFRFSIHPNQAQKCRYMITNLLILQHISTNHCVPIFTRSFILDESGKSPHSAAAVFTWAERPGAFRSTVWVRPVIFSFLLFASPQKCENSILLKSIYSWNKTKPFLINYSPSSIAKSLQLPVLRNDITAFGQTV